jgi:acyl carrier protein
MRGITMDVIHEIKNYIISELAYDYPKDALTPEVDLLSGGIIDSMGVLELSAFIEKKFGVSILPEDMIPENFRTLTTLKAFVESKQK